LVSCVIFTVWMSLAASSSRTSSSGTLGGMPFSTSLGWTASGSGYVW